MSEKTDDAIVRMNVDTRNLTWSEDWRIISPRWSSKGGDAYLTDASGAVALVDSDFVGGETMMVWEQAIEKMTDQVDLGDTYWLDASCSQTGGK